MKAHKKIFVISIVILMLAACELNQVKSVNIHPKKQNKNDLEKLLIDENFNGTIYIKKNNKVLMNQAFGIKNSNHEKLSTNDMFLIGSCQKFITGIIVKKLEEQHLINRNDQVSEYISEFNGMNITIQDLLMHRSGLTNIDPQKEFIGLDRKVSKIADNGIDSETYRKYHYNDSNYIILGKIIENVTHLSYQKNIERYIIEPLNLNQTAFYNNDEKQVNFVNGIKKDDAHWVDIFPYGLDQYDGAANLYMSSQNIAILVEAFLNEDLLRKESLQEITNVVDGIDQPYRYGFNVKENYYRIRGAFFSQEVIGWFNQDVIIVISSNTYNHQQTKLNEKLVEKIFKKLSSQ